jgi:hypothetical protein
MNRGIAIERGLLPLSAGRRPQPDRRSAFRHARSLLAGIQRMTLDSRLKIAGMTDWHFAPSQSPRATRRIQIY